MTPVTPGETIVSPRAADSDPQWQYRWFRIPIPPPAEDLGQRLMTFDCWGEHTAWMDGEPWAGIDNAHPWCPLPSRACTVFVRTGTWQTGIGDSPIKREILKHRFSSCRLLERVEPWWSLSWDLDVLVDLALHLHRLVESGGKADFVYGPPALRHLLGHIERIADAVDTGDAAAVRTATEAAFTHLRAEPWAASGGLVGYSHLDLVWLWPEHVTVEKGVHTAATVCRLLEQYPEFRFTWTQPWLYEAIEVAAPGLGKRIRGFEAEGRWETTGGAWTEFDTLLPCGEALARSMVLAQRWFTARRGEPSRLLWLSDCFGFSACLPMLCRQAGIEYFFTTKLNWSKVNRWPYESFVWRGPDGSEVLAHNSVEYCATHAGAVAANRAGLKNRQLAAHDSVLLVEGLGDGGGGPSEPMLERARRWRDLATLPRCSWTAAETWFGGLATARTRLPTHEGECYLELHRGCLTSQAATKLAYRQAERALQAAEAVAVMTGAPIRTDGWFKRLALAQFHDALPGSSIGLVYEQLNRELAEIAAAARDGALAACGGGGEQAAVNPLPVALRITREDGYAILPPLSVCAVSELNVRRDPVTSDGRTVRNGRLRVGHDTQGGMVGLAVDGWAAPLAGAIGLWIHHDRPHAFDAWDLDQHSWWQGEPVAFATPCLRAGGYETLARLPGGSEAVLRWHVRPGCPWVHGELEVDWREEHRWLRLSIPTAFRGGFWRTGTPYGSFLRDPRPGGPEREAAWEVPFSRWLARGNTEDDALAVVCEAKYGCACRDGEISVSLLRASTEPDLRADRGRHVIRFAIGRHRAVSVGEDLATAAAAEALFAEPLWVRGPASPALLDGLDTGSLVPVWALPANAASGWILRLHEVADRRGMAHLRVAGARHAEQVDLLERPLGVLERENDGWRLPYAPQQLLSVRFAR
jgi:alpha-mannosidase